MQLFIYSIWQTEPLADIESDSIYAANRTSSDGKYFRVLLICPVMSKIIISITTIAVSGVYNGLIIITSKYCVKEKKQLLLFTENCRNS